jgi:hypothetical protein
MLNANVNSTTVQKFGVNQNMLAQIATVRATRDDFVPLTADDLLAYCNLRLRDLDRQVQSLFAKQTGRNSLNIVLSRLQDKLTSTVGEQIKDVDQLNAIRADFMAAINAAQSGGFAAEADALRGQLTQFDATTRNADNEIDKAELKDLADAVTNVQSDLNRGGELDMIKMQSLMSARQQAVGLTTNMLQTLGQTLNQIVQNMRG